MMSRRQGLLLIAPLLLVLTGFFLVPVLMLLPTSFGVYEPGAGLVNGAWSLKNYSQIVTDDYYREVIWRTLGLGFSVTLLCLLLGYPLAYLIARGPERWRVPLILLVIFPMLRETTFVIMAITFINSLKVYDIVYVMTYGGPANQTQVLGTWMYFLTYNFNRIGLGTAIAMVLFALTLIFAIPYTRKLSKD